jgi:hypothetical protein
VSAPKDQFSSNGTGSFNGALTGNSASGSAGGRGSLSGQASNTSTSAQGDGSLAVSASR